MSLYLLSTLCTALHTPVRHLVCCDDDDDDTSGFSFHEIGSSIFPECLQGETHDSTETFCGGGALHQAVWL